MLIGFGMPAVTGVTLAGGSWLTADAGAALHDGLPARASRINRTGALTITLQLAQAVRPRIIGLLGTSLAIGDTAAAASASGTATRLPDGSVAVWMLPTAAATDTVAISINTNRTMVEIGEIVVMDAVHVGIRDGWQIERLDPSVHHRSRGGQVRTVPRATYRRFTGEFSPRAVELVRKGGIEGHDWETIAASLSAGGRGVIVPQYRDMLTKQPDPELAARTAMYGYALELPGAANVQRQYFGSYMAFEEIPAGV